MRRLARLASIISSASSGEEAKTRPSPPHHTLPMATSPPSPKRLTVIHPITDHKFILPVKRIHDGDDVSFFLVSKAYTEIMTFIFQLNASMFPRKVQNNEDGPTTANEWKLDDPAVSNSSTIQNLTSLLKTLTCIIDEAPPDPGPRRFGNISFRKWHSIVRDRLSDLLDQHLPAKILSYGSNAEVSAKVELEAYLIGSFGSSQRLDYGTGHELSFLAFLGCLWKLGAFPETEDGDQERAIVIGIIEP